MSHLAFDALVTRVLADTAVHGNPYFAALREQRFALPDFVETQIQFHDAVVFFSRPMAAVAAKIPSARSRVEILRNVWEEHGEGANDHHHGTTFMLFLERLAGLSQADVDARVLWPEVRQFNTTLTGACVMDDYAVGVGVLGAIERMFADISCWIGNAVVANGWLTEERLVHYRLHQELDVRHSEDFFDVLRPLWSRGKDERYLVEQGLRLGATAFDGLYRGLWNGRARRWLRET
jgi:pyrroloquinoline-quinone synthase